MKKLFFPIAFAVFLSISPEAVRAQTNQIILPGGSSGQVLFNEGGLFSGDANFFWNNRSKRLGIGTFLPAGLLELNTNSNMNYPNLLLTESEGEFARLMFKNMGATNKNWTFAGNLNLDDSKSLMNLWYWNGSAGKNIISVTGDGKMGIGTSEPTADLEVDGTLKIGQNGAKVKEILDLEGRTPSDLAFVRIRIPYGSNDELRVLSFQICTDPRYNQYIIPSHLEIRYQNEEITVSYDTDKDYFKDKTFRITLMRIEK